MSLNSHPQLALPLQWPVVPDFNNYVVGANEEAVAALRATAQGRGDKLIFVWGAAGVGKSHLLQAVCASAQQRGAPAAYLALAREDALASVEAAQVDAGSVISLDELEAARGQPILQTALFCLYNRVLQEGAYLVCAASMPPPLLPIELPDLVSRLAHAVVYHLRALDETAAVAVLRDAARQRGIELTVDVERYLVTHVRRDVASLLAIFARLDHAALATQRRMTVPFIKQVLENG